MKILLIDDAATVWHKHIMNNPPSRNRNIPFLKQVSLLVDPSMTLIQPSPFIQEPKVP